MPTTSSSIIALDVGGRRIGVAVASLAARLASPLTTLDNDDRFWFELDAIIDKGNVGAVVVGLPRGMQGQETAQTAEVRAFVEELQKRVALPVFLQDESLTSVQAEEELRAAGKKVEKGMIDALAATYILEDFLRDHQEIDV